MASVRSFDVLRCVCVCAHVCEAVMAYLSACHFFFPAFAPLCAAAAPVIGRSRRDILCSGTLGRQ